MTRLNISKIEDVSAKKINKIEALKRQVNDAAKRVALAEVKYNSLVEKANTFTELYQEAEATRQTTESYWILFLKIKSSLHALQQTSDETDLVAVDALYDLRQLVVQWNKVTKDTIKAAEVIQLMAETIEKRKASNPLISDDLVNDASTAALDAEKTVKVVIAALRDTLRALASATQAKNSMELTNFYIEEASIRLLANAERLDGKKPNLASIQKLGISETEQKAIENYQPDHKSLELSLYNTLQAAHQNVSKALVASENANKEVNVAKEELARAEAKLSTLEAALAAAESALAA